MPNRQNAVQHYPTEQGSQTVPRDRRTACHEAMHHAPRGQGWGEEGAIDSLPTSGVDRRIEMEGGGWRVTLQAVPNLKDLLARLKEESGRAIAHVGKAERCDGSPFTREESHELFDALYYFLSFVRGQWAPTVLYTGFTSARERAWEDWTARIASPWKFVLSWFANMEPQNLSGIFAGFMKLWQNPDWQDINKVAIHWFVEANNVSGAIEGSVMMTQNALERLAYYDLVHVRGLLKEKNFESGGKGAAERLRLLLSTHNIRNARSNSMHNRSLPQLAITRGWQDGPQALVALRNYLMHPDLKNQQRLKNYPNADRQEAWIVGLWYLEVVLLKLFGYSGPYFSRLTCHTNGQTEPIP